MSASLSGRARELLEQPNFCHVVTKRSDGEPHAALVWIDVDGDEVLLNSAEGRAWPTNLEHDPQVLLTVANSENAYEYVQIRGRAVEHTTEGAAAHIDKLAKKYLGVDVYPAHEPGVARVIFTIEPDKVSVHGG